VLVLALAGVLTVAAVLMAFVAGALAAQRRAAAAADLAALAAAAAAQDGHDACSTAATLAARNDARLHSCRTTAGEVRLVVEVRAASLLGRELTVQGRARAGPVS
jgi:secretion/DNA translocation related TadE-like protein